MLSLIVSFLPLHFWVVSFLFRLYSWNHGNFPVRTGCVVTQIPFQAKSAFSFLTCRDDCSGCLHLDLPYVLKRLIVFSDTLAHGADNWLCSMTHKHADHTPIVLFIIGCPMKDCSLSLYCV